MDGGRSNIGGAPCKSTSRAQQPGHRSPPGDGEIHSYPARMHPATAKELVSIALGGDAAGGTLFDPFCGSGTALTAARELGANAVGVDANPLAIALCNTKLWIPSMPQLKRTRQCVHRIVEDTIATGKQARHADYQKRPCWTPPGVNAKTRNEQLAGWFAPHVRRELEHIAEAIYRESSRDARLRQRLVTLLAAILHKVSRRSSDTNPDRTERRVARGACARLFRDRFRMLEKSLSRVSSRGASGYAVLGDARELALARIAPASMDAIVTSPPYAGVYNYHEHHTLRMAFLGMDAKQFQAREIGSRSSAAVAKSPKPAVQWKKDLSRVFEQMATVLRPGRRSIIMLGDSLVADQVIDAGKIVREIAGPQFEITAWAAQERPKWGARERDRFGKRDKREHIILCTRVSARKS